MRGIIWIYVIVALEVDGALKLEPYTSKEARQLYEEFKVKYDKNHQNEADEVRFQIFRDNLRRAQTQQAQERGTAVYGVTKFSDLTNEEFRRKYTGAKPSKGTTQKVDDSVLAELTDPPESYDWRDHNAVGPVEDQGECGSCWAFAAVGAIEGRWAIVKGTFKQLSKQQPVECDEYNFACGGGDPEVAIRELVRFGGLESAITYPYTDYVEDCKKDTSKFVAYVNGSQTITENEDTIKEWVAANGPISVTLNSDYMQFYRRGINRPPVGYCNKFMTDHSAVLVGYGVEKDKPFWIVKNAWGDDYGEQGYYRLYRGDGACGIDQYGVAAVIE